MVAQIELGEITLEVVKKDIKNIHLSVYPPTGKIRISAPNHMDLDTIRVFAASKIGWIRQQQKKLTEQERESPREYLDRESHYVWGKRYLLEVVEHDDAPSVELKFSKLVLKIRPGTSAEKRQDILDEWYREQVKLAVPEVVAKLSPALGVTMPRLHVQRMKTRWGSCCPHSQSIRLNSELAKKPPECLEYVVAHEMAHMLEATHNRSFSSIMDGLVPQWQLYKEILNRLPVRHEEWGDYLA